MFMGGQVYRRSKICKTKTWVGGGAVWLWAIDLRLCVRSEEQGGARV